jgi:hypothetical protein
VAIQYLQQKEINYLKWDRCINDSLNGVIYAQSWYLDSVAEKWNALIEDDYIAVLPLVVRHRALYREIFSPPLIKQLGVFSLIPITQEKIEKFIEAIPKKFRKIHICFNRQNTQAFKILPKTCNSVYELDLITPIEKKLKTYSKKLNSSLAIAYKNKLTVLKHISLYDFEQFIGSDDAKGQQKLSGQLHKIISYMMHINQVEILGVYGPVNMLCAAACFVRSNNNVLLLYAFTNPIGEQFKANHLLIDFFLQKYSARNITLSFDHMDRSWNKDLFREFGAQESYYYCYKSARFPLRQIF